MAKNPEPVLLELAALPREQTGPFVLLGLDKDAGKEDVEANWAERVKWARKAQFNVALEDINWAREAVADPERRPAADAASVNADTTEGVVARVTRRFGLGAKRPAPSWEPLDEEKPLADHRPAVEVPDAEAVRAAIVVPDVPREMPAAARMLEELARSPVDPWSLQV